MVSSGKMTTRETSFRESDHPGIVFPGNVLSGKMTIRETTINLNGECDAIINRNLNDLQTNVLLTYDFLQAVNSNFCSRTHRLATIGYTRHR